MTKIDAASNRNMKIELTTMNENTCVNFIESIRSPQTKRNYTRDLKVFLNLIPNNIYEDYDIKSPKSHELEDLYTSFVNLAKKDTSIIKTIIKSYVSEIKKKVESKELNPNSVSNRIKPIKVLLTANEIDISWKLINKMFPRETKSEDLNDELPTISKIIHIIV